MDLGNKLNKSPSNGTSEDLSQQMTTEEFETFNETISGDGPDQSEIVDLLEKIK